MTRKHYFSDLLDASKSVKGYKIKIIWRENMKLSELYTGQIVENDGIEYYVVLVIPKTKARETVNGEYVGTVRLFRVDTGEYKNYHNLEENLTVSKNQMTEEEKKTFLVKLQLSERLSKDVNTYVDAKFEDIRNVFHLKEGEKVLVVTGLNNTYYRVMIMENGELIKKTTVAYEGTLYCIEEERVEVDNLFVGKKIEHEIKPTIVKEGIDIQDKVLYLKNKIDKVKETIEKEPKLTNKKLGKYCMRSLDTKRLQLEIKNLYYNELKKVQQDYVNEEGKLVFTKYHSTSEDVTKALEEIYQYLVKVFDINETKTVQEQIKEEYPEVDLVICTKSADKRKQIRQLLPRIH